MGQPPDHTNHKNLPWDPVANIYFLDDGGFAVRLIGRARQKVPNPIYAQQFQGGPGDDVLQRAPKGEQYVDAEVFRYVTRICKTDEEVVAVLREASSVFEEANDTGAGVIFIKEFLFDSDSGDEPPKVPEGF